MGNQQCYRNFHFDLFIMSCCCSRQHCCMYKMPRICPMMGSAVIKATATEKSTSCETVWPSGKALGWQAEGPWFKSALALLSLQKLWFMDTVFVILLPTVNDTLKWLSSLPALMQNPSGGDSVVLGMVSLFPHFLGTQSPLRLCEVSAPLWRQLGIKQV